MEFKPLNSVFNDRTPTVVRVGRPSCSRFCLVALLLVNIGLGGCSKSNGTTSLEDEQQQISLADPNIELQSASAIQLPRALLDIQASSTLSVTLPSIVSVETLAESGLQVAYTHIEQSNLVAALDVEAGWLHMQSCLRQVGVAPLVLIYSDDLKPLTLHDDVIYSIDGVALASASLADIPVIQILLADFTMLGEAYGYNLRSMMGRLLWLSEGLSARDYEYSCARELAKS